MFDLKTRQNVNISWQINEKCKLFFIGIIYDMQIEKLRKINISTSTSLNYVNPENWI